MKKKLYSSLLAISMVFNTAPSMSSITEVFADSTVEPAINLNDNVDVVSEIYNSFAQTFGANVIDEAATDLPAAATGATGKVTISHITSKFEGNVEVVYGDKFATTAAILEVLGGKFAWTDADSSLYGDIDAASDWFKFDKVADVSDYADNKTRDAGESFEFALTVVGDATYGSDVEFDADAELVTFTFVSAAVVMTSANLPISIDVTLANDTEIDDYMDGFVTYAVETDKEFFVWTIDEGTAADSVITVALSVVGSATTNYDGYANVVASKWELDVTTEPTGVVFNTESLIFDDGYDFVTVTTMVDVTDVLPSEVTGLNDASFITLPITWDPHEFDANAITVYTFEGTYGETGGITVGADGKEYSYGFTTVTGTITVLSNDADTNIEELFDDKEIASGFTVSFDAASTAPVQVETPTEATIEFAAGDGAYNFLTDVTNNAVTIAVDSTQAVTSSVATEVNSTLGLSGDEVITAIDTISDTIVFKTDETNYPFPEMTFKFDYKGYDDSKTYVIGMLDTTGKLVEVVEATKTALSVTPVSREIDTITDYVYSGDITPVAGGEIALMAVTVEEKLTASSVKVAVGTIDGMSHAYILDADGNFISGGTIDDQGDVTFSGIFTDLGVYTVLVATDADSNYKYDIGKVTVNVTDNSGSSEPNTAVGAASETPLKASVSFGDLYDGYKDSNYSYEDLSSTVTIEDGSLTIALPTKSAPTSFSGYNYVNEIFTFDVTVTGTGTGTGTGVTAVVDISSLGLSTDTEIAVFEYNTSWTEVTSAKEATAGVMATRTAMGTISESFKLSPSGTGKVTFPVDTGKTYSIAYVSTTIPTYTPSTSTGSSGSSSSGGTYSSYSTAYSTSALRVNGTVISELQNISVGEMINLDRITTINGRDILGWYTDSALTKEITNTSTFVVTSDILANGLFVKLSGGVSETLPDGSYNAGAGTDTSGTYTPSTVPSTIAKLLGKLF